MNLSELWENLNTRLTGDTGTGGLFNATTPLVTGLHLYHAPDNAQMPYIVMSTPSNTHESGDGFDVDVIDHVVLFSVYINKKKDTQPLREADKIIKRIYGDWYMDDPDRVPSYGLHRWSQPSADAWEFDAVRHVDSTATQDQNVLIYQETYETMSSLKVGAGV